MHLGALPNGRASALETNKHPSAYQKASRVVVCTILFISKAQRQKAQKKSSA